MFGLDSIATLARKVLRLQPKNQGTLANPDLLFRCALGNLSLTGISVTEEHAVGVSTVYACIRQISQAIATVPVGLYERLPDGGKRHVVGDADNAVAEVVRTRPNEEMNGVDFRLAATAGLTLYQNSVSQIRRNRLGGVMELIPINPRDVEIVRDHESALLTPMGRKPLKYRIEGLSEPLDRSQVLHLKGLSFDGLEGMRMTRVARESIGLAVALDRNAAAFFGNSSRPGLVFEVPETLSDQAYERLVHNLNSAHQGVDRAYKALIAESGAKMQKVNSENRESQFDESRERQALEIARFFGVPPQMVGIQNSEPRANIEEENINFVNRTLRFYCEIWRQGLNHSVLSEEQRQRGLFFDFDLSQMLSGNLKDKAQAYRYGGDLSVLTKDEYRKHVYGLNPLADGTGRELIIPPNVKRDKEPEADEE